MTNNLHPQSQQYIFINQGNPQKTKTAHGDVRQDKSANRSARSPSHRPVRSHIPMRSDALTTKTPRSQNPLIATGPKVPLGALGDSYAHREPLGFDHRIGHFRPLRIIGTTPNSSALNGLGASTWDRSRWGGRRHDQGPKSSGFIT